MVESITEEDVTVKLNAMVAKQYMDNLAELQDTYGLAGQIDISPYSRTA